METPQPSKLEWLKTSLPQDSIVAVDPYLLSSTEFSSLMSELEINNIKLKGIYTNFVDEVWNDQPEPIFGEIKPHLLTYSGLKSSEKIKNLKDILKEKNANSMIVTSSADISCKYKDQRFEILI